MVSRLVRGISAALALAPERRVKLSSLSIAPDMTQASDMPQRQSFARIGHFVAARRKLVFDYLSAIGGAGGRLVFSLAYFIALANTLSIAEFGMFATASAAGIMLSRILAFGFISALYRTATIRP